MAGWRNLVRVCIQPPGQVERNESTLSEVHSDHETFKKRSCLTAFLTVFIIFAYTKAFFLLFFLGLTMPRFMTSCGNG